MRLKRIFLLLVLLAAPLAWLVVACSADTLPPKGQLMLVLTSDMAPPKDFDSIRIEIARDGTLVHSADYDIASGAASYKLPATLGIVSDGPASTPVDIRVVARQGGLTGKARVVRDTRTVVPRDRVAMLPIAIQWLCDGTAKEEQGIVSSTCGDGQTCVGGACRPVTTDATTLADYEPEKVFGPSGAPTCFDTLACFGQGAVVDVDTACSIAKPADGRGINVALVGPPGSAGVCGSDACLVPLDADALSGFTVAGDRVVLPPSVCQKQLAVAVTSACETKPTTIGTCGVWSTGGAGTPAAPPPRGVDTSSARIGLTLDPVEVQILASETKSVRVNVARRNVSGKVVVSVSDLGAGLATRSIEIADGETSKELVITSNQATQRRLEAVVRAELGTLVETAKLVVRVRPPAGELDEVFGDRGTTVAAATWSAQSQNIFPKGISGLTVQPDGKVIAMGSQTAPGAGTAAIRPIRFLTDGRIDPTFDAGFITGTNGHAAATSTVVEADGRILVGGVTADTLKGHGMPIAVRYNADGTIATPLVEWQPSGATPSCAVFVRADMTALGASYGTQWNGFPDGGREFITQPNTSYQGFRILKFTPTPDGKIIALGTRDPSFGVSRNDQRSFQPDPTFNAGQVLVFDAGAPSDAGVSPTAALVASAVQPDGKILVYATKTDGTTQALLVRFTTAGALDSTFGDRGMVTRPGVALAVALQNDGKVLVLQAAGVITHLLRFNANGGIDGSFGASGDVSLGFDAQTMTVDGNTVLIGGGDTTSWKLQRIWL